MNQSELTAFLEQKCNAVSQTLLAIAETTFWHKSAPEVWSIAENVQHLVQSAAPVVRLLNAPREVLLERFDKAAAPSRSYEEVVQAYKTVLATGVKASGNFLPQIAEGINQEMLQNSFAQTNASLVESIDKWNEADLDEYVIPHPVLGPLTVREMLYFTAYHNQHHHEKINFLSNIA
jgi:DinB superfamily